MPIHKEERLLSYNAEQIFDLVIAVDRYPEFLPWCLSANIIKEVDQTFDADLVIGFKMFRQRFISRVTSRRPDWIEVIPISGPFKRMNNSWRFKTQSEDTCMIDFYVDFEFRSRLLNKLMGALFQEAVRRMVGAFEKRAFELYGTNNRCLEPKRLV
ncbi:MAG: type II toxin-antitoxin system RatA family toxin [Alphaproteobacteria bacterium]